MPKHLYELTADIRRALAALAPDGETGEIPEDAGAELAALEMAFNAKAENVAKFIRNLEQEIDENEGRAKPFVEEGQRYLGRAKIAALRIVRLKAYLREQMAALGRDRVDGADLKISLGKAPQVANIFAPEMIPAKYQRHEPDRSTIRAALKDGAEIPGAKLMDGKRTLRIR